MKKRYIKPEIEEVIISMQLLAGSPTMDFKGTETEEDVVDDFNQLL